MHAAKSRAQRPGSLTPYSLASRDAPRSSPSLATMRNCGGERHGPRHRTPYGGAGKARDDPGDREGRNDGEERKGEAPGEALPHRGVLKRPGVTTAHRRVSRSPARFRGAAFPSHSSGILRFPGRRAEAHPRASATIRAVSVPTRTIGPVRDGDGTFRVFTDRQAGDSESSRFFLDTSGIGEDDRTILHELQEVQIPDGVDQPHARRRGPGYRARSMTCRVRGCTGKTRGHPRRPRPGRRSSRASCTYRPRWRAGAG